MMENLMQLKMVLPIFSAAAAVLCFAVFRMLIRIFLERMDRKNNGRKNGSGEEFFTDGEENAGYVRIIAKETLKHTWIMNTAGTVCVILLVLTAFFHRRILLAAGAEIYLSVFMILSVTAVYFIRQDRRWKTSACDDLILYTRMFAGAARDLHSGIRQMLYDSDTEIPFRDLLLEIQKNHPGISGRELLAAAGQVLKSEKLAAAFEDGNVGNTVKKSEVNEFGESDTFNTVFVFLAFGNILILCFLL